MRLTAALALLSATALLAAPVAAQKAMPNPYSDQLAALPDLQRRAALRRAILDTGEKCVRVEKAALQGPYKNVMMWVARCTGNLDYGAFVGADGSVQVSSCAYLVTVHWPACRKLD